MIKKLMLIVACLGLLLFTACDGKQTVNIVFDSQGGSDVPAITDKKDFDVDNLPVPTREGYTFLGWYLDMSHVESIVDNVPEELEFTLYAKWEPIPYTITFDSKGGSAVSPITAPYEAAITAPPAPQYPEYVFVGWYLDEAYTQPFTFAKMPLNGAKLYAKWDIAPITITFVTGLPLTVDPVQAQKGEEITLPTPTYAGYEFVGWYSDEAKTTPFTETTMPAADVTLYAKWNPLKVNYSIEYYIENADDDDYKLAHTDRKEELTGTEVTATPLELAWATENEDHPDRVASGTVAGDGSLVLKLYYKRNTYTLTVNGAGGIDADGEDEVTIVAKYDAALTAPVFTRKGYRFESWSTDFPAKMPLSNLTITATWQAVYVDYKVEHYQENALDNNYTLIETETHTELVDHEVEATVKTYLGFTVNEEHPDSLLEGITLDNDQLTLKVYYKRNTYTISFKDEEGQPLSIAPIAAKYGAPITAPEGPTKLGYAFAGWFPSLDATESFAFTTMPIGGTTLYARYEIKLYTITFVSNAEISVTSIKAEYNTPITAPSTPIRPGYTFVCWCSDEELKVPYEFTFMPAEDITLYAKWQPNVVTVTFVYNDGRPNTQYTGDVGSSFTAILPEREAYTFDAWYRDSFFDEVFDEWIVPVTNTTLYANWIPNDYTIVFVSGFEDVEIEPLEAPYDSTIVLPEPEKEGYAFDGWFVDAETTIPFTLNRMPFNGATLYAKWVEADAQSSIAYALSRQPGTPVVTKGVVYAKLLSPYTGFFIQDKNNQIYCLGDQDSVEIGDEVEVTGYVELWNAMPMIHGINDIKVNSAGNTIKDPVEMTIDELALFLPYGETYGTHVRLEGVITNEDDQLYLVDLHSYNKLLISHKSYNRFDIEIEANKLYSGEYVLYGYDLPFQLVLIADTLEEIPLTDMNKLEIVKDGLLNLARESYLPNSEFRIPDRDLFNWATITFSIRAEDAANYDGETGMLADADDPYEVNFNVTISVGELSESFTLTVSVEPYTITTIYEFLNDEERDDVYYLKGIVIRTAYWESTIQDETGVLVISWDDESPVELGEEVIVMLDGDDYYTSASQLVKVVSTNNALPEAVALTEESLIVRQEEWNYLYQGQYVELRGLLTLDMNEYWWEPTVYLYVGSIRIYVYDTNYVLGKGLPFTDMEVIMRGYLFFDYDEWCLYYDNNRHDLQLPEYTDLERVSAIQQSIINRYRNITLHALDYFDIPACHPVLGGKISWQMASGYEEYYNAEAGCFIEVDEPTPIVIEINIVYSEVNISFAMNKTLYPESVVKIAELAEIADGEEVVVKGLVIYRHFSKFYLQDDTGLVFVHASDNQVSKGDYIRLRAIKRSNDTLAQLDWEGEPIRIISRDNPVSLEPVIMSVADLMEINVDEEIPVGAYVELTGILKTTSGYDLVYGDYYITIIPIDGYTDNELMLYNERIVRIRCYLDDYDTYYREWELMFTGLAGEIEAIEYTDQEKMDFIKAFLNSMYKVTSQSGGYHHLLLEYPLMDAVITYEIIKDEYDCYDMETGYLKPVPENTTVEMEATITINEFVEVVPIKLNVIRKTMGVDKPITPIADFKESNGETLTIYGKIIEMYADALLVEDETGMIFVSNARSLFYTYNLYINAEFSFTGYLIEYRGRKAMYATSYESMVMGGSDTVDYEPVTLAEIVNYDHRDDSVYGKLVKITGTLIRKGDYYSDEYFLTDGFDTVRLENVLYIPDQYIGDFVGFEITIEGRVFGVESSYFGGDAWTIQVARKPVVMKEYEDEEIIDLIGEIIVSQYGNRVYNLLDEFYFDSEYPAIPGLGVYVEIINGEDVLDFYDSYGYFNWTEVDREITFSVTLSYGELEKTFTFTIIVEGITLASLEDVFLETDGTEKLYLRGTMLFIAADGVYFLIEDQVYFLANAQSYGDIGADYLISGYRAEFDGEMNLRYYPMVEMWIDWYYGDYPEPELYTIQEIYLEDPYDLGRKVLNISGTLKYEPCSGYYYLENLGEKVYLRVINPESGDFIGGYMPDSYIDRQIIVRCLFPNKTIKGKYLFDIYTNEYGDVYEAITAPEYTPTECVELAKAELLKYYEQRHFHSFEWLWLESWMYNCYLTYELVNPEDEQYLYYDKYGDIYVNWLTEPVTIDYNVTITYEGEAAEPVEDTIVVTVVLLPSEILSIKELRYQQTNTYCTIKGIVQEVSQYNWMIIKDETGTVFVDADGDFYDGVNFEVGDEVIVYGRYEYYPGNPKPNIDQSYQILIVSRGNPVTTPEPVELSVQEVFVLDYLDPDLTGTYITVTGSIVQRWSTYYLTDGDDEIEIMPVVNGDVNANVILSQLAYGDEVAISGYLFGLYSCYNRTYWSMSFAGVVQNLE